MNRIVVVEDDQNKAERLVGAVQDIVAGATVILKRSVLSAVRDIVDNGADCIVLDMSLTTFDVGPDEEGGKPQPFGGVEVLRQLDRWDIYLPTIVVTQFERFGRGRDAMDLCALDQWLKAEHGETYQGLVYYSSSHSKWREELCKRLNAIVTGKSNDR